MIGFTSKKVKLQKTAINYVTVGRGKTLVFVHGLTNDWLVWVPLAKVLRKNYRLYLIDLPGYGDSGGLPGYSLTKQARFLRAFIKKLRLKPLCIIGVSMGATVVAKLEELYPKIASRYILISAFFKTGWRKRFIVFYQAFLRGIKGRKWIMAVLKKLITSRAWVYLASAFFNMEKFDKKLIDKFNMAGKKKMTKGAFVDMSISVNATSLETILANCSAPTLVVQGTGDKMCSYEKALSVLKQQKNIDIVPVKNGSHLLYLERPKEVAGVISNYLM